MSKFVVALVVLLALTSCSNSEQEEATARQAQRERRENEEVARLKAEREKAEQEARAQMNVDQPTEPEEPAAPSEPEYKEVDYYVFTSVTEKTPVQCETSKEGSGCGLTFEDCKTGKTYYCQVGVSYVVKTEKKLVQ